MSGGRWVPEGARADRPQAAEPARLDWRVREDAFKSDGGAVDPPEGAAGDAAATNEQGAQQ